MRDPRTGLVKSPFTILESDSNVTKASADIVTATEGTLFTYKVPLGVAIEITPANFFFIDLIDTADNAVVDGADGIVKLIKDNQTETEKREVWSGPDTLFSGNIYDVRTRPQIRAPVILNASQKLLIVVKATVVGGIDKDNSKMTVECMQYYEEV